MASLRQRKTRLLAWILFGCVALGLVAAIANAKTIGTVPPRDPKANCQKKASASEQWTITSVDRCRADEGVGPMVLPRNWAALTTPERLLVVIDLERVNRGLAPISGLSKKINALAETGAKREDDPNFPSHFLGAAGSIWAGAGTVFEADFGWMYQDGWGGTRVNLDCTSKHARGCWGHRDNILMDEVPTLVGGGAYVKEKKYGSYAFEMLSGYSTKHLTFTWKAELKHFAKRPTLDPLKKPHISSISPRRGSIAGGTAVVINGSNLESISRVEFGGRPGAFLECLDELQCNVLAPDHSSGKVKVTAVNHSGPSRSVAKATFTYRG